ncbi:MAG: PAS domain-containing protein [Stellaceae bacterium]
MELPGAGPSAARYDFRADRVLRLAFDYWQAKRAGRGMPQRRDIEPVELRDVLPHLQITEAIGGGHRFRYRLIGTAIVEAFGAEFTGKYVDELVSGERDSFVHACYRAVCASRRPAFVRSKYVTTRNIDLTANRVLLPLSEDGEAVNQILGALTFEFTRPFRTGIGHEAQIDLSASYVDLLE